MEDMVERKTEVLVRKQLIFDHYAFFCMSLYAPLYVVCPESIEPYLISREPVA